MENQHRKITGYRDLTQAEIDAMNQVKAEGERLRDLIDSVGKIEAIDPRALHIARTELQTGMMWLVRAIARPKSF